MVRKYSTGFLFLFFLTSPLLLFSKEIKWLGGNGNWHEPKNWEGNTLPSKDDNAVIDSGTVTILKGALAELNQLQIKDGAQLLNNGHILIADSDGTAIRIENTSVLKNLKKGKIEILKAADTGIYVFDKSMLLNSGKILIGQQIMTTGFRGKQIGRNGLLIANQSIFRNNRKLEINNTAEEAIHNVQESVFANHKKITLGGANSLLQRHGIKNASIFTNHKKGRISIDGTYLDGIRNSDNGMFENSGKIKIGKVKIIASYGIFGQHSSKFRNEKKGKILFYKILKKDTKLGKQAKLSNSGKLIRKKVKKKKDKK